jgi:transposase-like protein
MSPRRHVSPDEKRRIVLRVLGGESRQTVAHESDVSVDRIERWESRFLAAGERGLASRRHSRSRAGRVLAAIGPWALLLAVLFVLVFFLTRLMESGGSQ